MEKCKNKKIKIIIKITVNHLYIPYNSYYKYSKSINNPDDSMKNKWVKRNNSQY